MKFLLDLCVSSISLIGFLQSQGHDVLAAPALAPGSSDEVLLQRAMVESRILVTEDKDFGELIFARQLNHGVIIRFVGLAVDDQVRALRDFIEGRPRDLQGRALIPITRHRIRLRRQ